MMAMNQLGMFDLTSSSSPNKVNNNNNNNEANNKDVEIARLKDELSHARFVLYLNG